MDHDIRLNDIEIVHGEDSDSDEDDSNDKEQDMRTISRSK